MSKLVSLRVTGTLNRFKNFSIIHIFEPVPTFNKILSERWDNHKMTNGWDATINNFGLGLNDRLETFLEQACPQVRPSDNFRLRCHSLYM